ncbi:hypothetical protein NWI01_28080 [Nitrobacter winogradskyi]|uniref:Uncharacterized protein n=1 Tax=Nitrobacter winogradskyi TaxID=913 RepID=A0A4Y3WI05_NITWI|nr:hypothetical protein NWI01_28080 [Nitrobacter winogradskyi]
MHGIGDTRRSERDARCGIERRVDIPDKARRADHEFMLDISREHRAVQIGRVAENLETTCDRG